MRRVVRILVAAALLLTPGAVTARADGGVPVVESPQGAVRGIAADGTWAYRGLPYASAGRWEPPRDDGGWTGVRDAGRFGPACVPFVKGSGSGPGFSEDCLSVNVTKPAGASAAPRPVLFWIYGGGFYEGRGDIPDPTRLARSTNTVVVTFNYRLGPLGFFAPPGGTDRRVNLALLDQQAALRWTARNIAAYGGDPARVAIVGQSAGGISVCAHMVSPASAGLFSRAVAQSAGCDALVAPDAARMRAAARELGRGLGCPDGAGQLACMKARPVAEIRKRTEWDVNVIATEQPPPWTPTVDGVTLPDLPSRLVDRGLVRRVPFLSGNTRHEGRLMVAGLYHWRHFRRVTAEDLDRLLVVEARGGAARLAGMRAAYTAARHGTRDKAYAAVITDGMACPIDADRRRFAAQGVPVGGYEFNGTVPFGDLIDGWWGMPLGSFHGTDQSYLFQRPLGPLPDVPLSGDRRRLAEAMGRYWGAFAAHGTPRAPGLPDWPSYAAGGLQRLEPGAIGPLTRERFRADHHCAVWDAPTAG